MKYLPEHFYHLYNRGAGKARIFLEKENYRFFLRRLRKYLTNANAQLLVYCLMPNHYHAVVRLGGSPDFSNVLRGCITSYVRSFNAWYHRSGYLFQENTQAILIEGEDYLMHLCRYVHLNPVAAGLVSSPECWEHSNYRGWVTGGLVDHSPMRELRDSLFGSADRYRRFVMDYEAAEKMRDGIERKLFADTGVRRFLVEDRLLPGRAV